MVLLLAFCLLFFAPPIFAQTSSPAALPASNFQPQSPTSNLPLPTSISPTSPLYTDLLVNNLFHSFSCLAVGQSLIGQPCLIYQVTKNAQGMIQSVPMLSQVNLSGGTLGAIGSIIESLYANPPVRTADYLASVGQGLGIVKEVHAQVVGSGAAVLTPILKLWQVSRNVSYVIMIIVFVIIGLMVMFRNRINPQTVITAQTALPGLIIGLILITFSFFLAGLLTDMAFVGTNLVGYYFYAAQPLTNSPQNLVADINNKSVITLFSSVIPDNAISFGTDNNANLIQHAVSIIFDSASTGVQSFIRFAAAVMAFQTANMIGHAVPVVGDLVGIATGLIGSATAAIFAPQIIGMLLSWVAMAILIYSMVKLLLRLISSYLTIIFLTITAPFQLLAAALPGRQGMATSWILNMLANVLVFPAVLAVLYFVAYLLNFNRPPVFNISGQAGIIGSHTLPLLGGLDTQFINYLLAFGALVALPSIPDIISRSIGRAGAAGQLIGQELSGNIRGGRGYSNQWQQAFGGARKIGQDITTFRGTEVGYSPSLKSGIAARFPRLGRREN